LSKKRRTQRRTDENSGEGVVKVTFVIKDDLDMNRLVPWLAMMLIVRKKIRCATPSIVISSPLNEAHSRESLVLVGNAEDE
jgi:hypothetical protein